jgi:hypothetical protein
MSYDLMVFDPTAPPKDREGFIGWYNKQTKWTEGHTYDNPAVTTPELRDWFTDIADQYPPMNGPHASDDVDDPKLTDYSIGNNLIYASFAWSEADAAYRIMLALAEKHRVGFFDVSSENGYVWLPTSRGFSCVHGGVVQT